MGAFALLRDQVADNESLSALRSLTMSFNDGFDDPTAWGPSPEAPSGDIVKDAIRKEQVLK